MGETAGAKFARNGIEEIPTLDDGLLFTAGKFKARRGIRR